MTLSTLVVCDAGSDKCREIEALVQSQDDLSLLETTSRQASDHKISQQNPKLVWIELEPDAQSGIDLLGELRGKHPNSQFVVSYPTLNADLVKSSMHKGAFDFLDAGTWGEQLPGVVKRMVARDNAAQAAARQKSEEESERAKAFAATADNVPVYSESVNKMRKNMNSVEFPLGPQPMPVWLLPAIILALVIIIVGVYLHH